jgi:hypothetical protein
MIGHRDIARTGRLVAVDTTHAAQPGTVRGAQALRIEFKQRSLTSHWGEIELIVDDRIRLLIDHDGLIQLVNCRNRLARKLAKAPPTRPDPRGDDAPRDRNAVVQCEELQINRQIPGQRVVHDVEPLVQDFTPRRPNGVQRQ